MVYLLHIMNTNCKYMYCTAELLRIRNSNSKLKDHVRIAKNKSIRLAAQNILTSGVIFAMGSYNILTEFCKTWQLMVSEFESTFQQECKYQNLTCIPVLNLLNKNNNNITKATRDMLDILPYDFLNEIHHMSKVSESTLYVLVFLKDEFYSLPAEIIHNNNNNNALLHSNESNILYTQLFTRIQCNYKDSYKYSLSNTYGSCKVDRVIIPIKKPIIEDDCFSTVASTLMFKEIN